MTIGSGGLIVIFDLQSDYGPKMPARIGVEK
jgi:hypothetical protein